MVGVVAGVQTPSGKRSMGLAHNVVDSGEKLTGASTVTMPEGPRTDGR